MGLHCVGSGAAVLPPGGHGPHGANRDRYREPGRLGLARDRWRREPVPARPRRSRDGADARRTRSPVATSRGLEDRLTDLLHTIYQLSNFIRRGVALLLVVTQVADVSEPLDQAPCGSVVDARRLHGIVEVSDGWSLLCDLHSMIDGHTLQ